MHTNSEVPQSSAAPSVWRDIRDAIRGSEHDYTQGPINRAIFLLAIPMVIEMSMESVFAVVDIFFVGKLGAAAVATVGLTESLMVVIYTVAMGLSIGVTATVARRIGEKDPDGAARAAVQSLLLGVALSAVLGIVGAIFAPQLLTLMGADADVLAVGTGYARVSLAANSSVFLLFLINAAFRGAGDAAVAMRVLVLGNAINIVLDPLLIFGVGPFPELGVTGAAWATAIGRGIGFGWALWHIGNGRGKLHVLRKHLGLEPQTMLSIARISGWGTFQVALASMSWIGLVRIMAMFGANAMAGYTIAIRILLFALMPAYGVGAAAATMVGQALGAENPDRAEQSVWTAARLNMILLGLTGVVFLIFAPTIIGWFTQDAAVHATAVFGLRMMSVGFPLYALGMVLEQSFNGAGDTKTPSWINFWVFWVLQIPLAWFLARHTGLGEKAVFIAVPVAYVALAIVSAILFKRGKWKGRVV